MSLAVLLAIVFFNAVNGAEVNAKANPIRKVVNMLQAMQQKVVAEGEKEEELFKKFMCYCGTNKGALGDTIAEAEAKAPTVVAAIDEASAAKAQLDEDLKAHG